MPQEVIAALWFGIFLVKSIKSTGLWSLNMSESEDDEGAPPSGLRVHTFGATGDNPKDGWDPTLQPKGVDPVTLAAAMGIDPDIVARAAAAEARPQPGSAKFIAGDLSPAGIDGAEARATRLKCLDLATQAVGAKDLKRLMEAARELVAFVNGG